MSSPSRQDWRIGSLHYYGGALVHRASQLAWRGERAQRRPERNSFICAFYP